MEQLQPPRRYLRIGLGHTREVSARPVRAGDKANLYRVSASFENNRDGRCRRLCRKRSRRTGCGNYRDLTFHQVGRQRSQPVILAIRPTLFNRYVAAHKITSFTQTFEECR